MEATATPEVTTTPTAAVETPAAPATSEPSSTSAVSQRPSSMRAAFEQVAAKQDASNPAKPPAATPPPGTQPPASAKATVPKETEWPRILESTRKKGEDALNAYKAQHGWAEKVPQQTFERVASDLNAYHTDPIGFVLKRIAEIEADPQFGPQWKARQGQPATTATPNLDPDVEVIGPDGKVTGSTYSAERQKALLKHELDQALKPFQTEREQREAATKKAETDRLHAEQHKANEAYADAAIAEILDILDGDKALLPDVDQLWAQHKADGWSAHRAALEVRKTKVTPRLAANSTQQAIDEMKRKAAGNTANGSGTTAMPARPKDVKQLAKWLEARAAQQA